MNFFEVTAKCGHVGTQNYFVGVFYERADSAAEAASIARTRPRVKHHHKDAILKVVKIVYAEYKRGLVLKLENPYYRCHNRQEHLQFDDVIAQNIFEELTTIEDTVQRTETTKNVYHGKIKIRKPNKYVRMNQMLDYDYELPGA